MSELTSLSKAGASDVFEAVNLFGGSMVQASEMEMDCKATLEWYV